jgi:hypothetical protein
MSAGKRDQRVRVFAFSNATADGWATSGYSYAGEFWAQVSAPTMREVTVGGQGEHVVDAVFSFIRDVVLELGGLLKAQGRYYKITGLPPLVRTSNERTAFATYVDDAQALAITGEPT